MATKQQKFIVETGWSDYVFLPSYHLLPLNDVAASSEKTIVSRHPLRSQGQRTRRDAIEAPAKVEELTLLFGDN